MSNPVDFTFRFTAEGDWPPVEIRVRRMLKLALRAFGLRACPSPAASRTTRPNHAR